MHLQHVLLHHWQCAAMHATGGSMTMLTQAEQPFYAAFHGREVYSLLI